MRYAEETDFLAVVKSFINPDIQKLINIECYSFIFTLFVVTILIDAKSFNKVLKNV